MIDEQKLNQKVENKGNQVSYQYSEKDWLWILGTGCLSIILAIVIGIFSNDSTIQKLISIVILFITGTFLICSYCKKTFRFKSTKSFMLIYVALFTMAYYFVSDVLSQTLVCIFSLNEYEHWVEFFVVLLFTSMEMAFISPYISNHLKGIKTQPTEEIKVQSKEETKQ